MLSLCMERGVALSELKELKGVKMKYMTYRQVVLIIMLYDIVKQVIMYFVKKIL